MKQLTGKFQKSSSLNVMSSRGCKFSIRLLAGVWGGISTGVRIRDCNIVCIGIRQSNKSGLFFSYVHYRSSGSKAFANTEPKNTRLGMENRCFGVI